MPQSSTETTSAGSPELEPHSQPEPEQVNWDYVRVLPDGECVSVDGTHLGHNLPDRSGNRSSARSNASSRLRQSDRRATAEPAAYGSRRPSRSGTAGPTGCRAEPRPRVPRTAALEPLRGAAQSTVNAPGSLRLAYGLRPMAYGLWPMAYGLWPMAYGLWPMAVLTHHSLPAPLRW